MLTVLTTVVVILAVATRAIPVGAGVPSVAALAVPAILVAVADDLLLGSPCHF